MTYTDTLIKSALQTTPKGLRVKVIAEEIGTSYSTTYQTLKAMEQDQVVYKVARGVYTLTEEPHFTTAECISLLQSLEGQEIAVEIAREDLHQAEAQLEAVKRTIRETMLTAFED